MQKKILLLALPLFVSGSPAMSESLLAGENAGSMDSMWSETDGKSSKPSKLPPLCSVQSLKDSELIKKGGWPGIGPFKEEGAGGKDDQYVDAAKNTLKVESSKNKITSAELRLNNQTKNTFLTNVEMSADFLLESLGAKAARISDFNTQLEKARQKLVTSSQNDPLSLSAGSYLVYLHPETDGTSKDKVAFIIKISGKDASPDVLRAAPPPEKNVEQAPAHSTISQPSHPAQETRTAPAPMKETIAEEPAKSEPAPMATAQPVTKTAPAPTVVKENSKEEQVKSESAPIAEAQPVTKTPTVSPTEEEDTAPMPLTAKSTAEDTTPSATSIKSTSSSPSGLNFGIETGTPKTPSKIAMVPPSSSQLGSTAPAPIAASSDAPVSLQDNFRDVVDNWQKIKKVAVRQRDISSLAQVLAGRALKRQSDAIGWLTTNKKYYEMMPKGVEIEKYDEITKGQKYAVYAKVRESSKLVDDPSGQVVKDSDDTYNVIYTIEKIADHWFISDSAIINQAVKSQKTK